MYHRTTSQESEVMNAANREVPSRVAVCPVSAIMLSIKYKCHRFKWQQAAAWAGTSELTLRGKKEYTEVFKGVNSCDFSINLVDRRNDRWEFSVQRNVVGGRQANMVMIPKVPTKGSYFGWCTCGLTQRDAIPCKPMVAVVVSPRVPVLLD
jgi:hypothetical protein